MMKHNLYIGRVLFCWMFQTKRRFVQKILLSAYRYLINLTLMTSVSQSLFQKVDTVYVYLLHKPVWGGQHHLHTLLWELVWFSLCLSLNFLLLRTHVTYLSTFVSTLCTAQHSIFHRVNMIFHQQNKGNFLIIAQMLNKVALSDS